MALATSAKEIQRQSVRIREQVEKFQNYETKMHADIWDILNKIVETEDSQLNQTIKQIDEIFEQLHTAIGDSYTRLAQAMETYAEKTIANEEQEQEQVGQTGTRLQTLKDMLTQVKL